ncbi:MAG: hypothetical protein Q4A92_11110 [Corynebacterium sp.]|nr:hypothetical protein [Corynebacterium sp.]
MSNETDNICTKPLPEWAAGVVNINNRHHNLYGNYSSTGEVYLRDDGMFAYADGQPYAPTDALYVIDGKLVREIPQSEIDRFARDYDGLIDNMIAKSSKIDRSAPRDDVAKRYPHACPHNGDWRVYAEVDAISDQHDPGAILAYFARKHFDQHQRFLPGYLHVANPASVSPRLQAAIRAYHKRGGPLGASAIEALDGDIHDGPCINHITLTTGHNRRSPRAEVSDETLAILHTWLLDACGSPDPVPLPAPSLAHYSAHVLRSPDGGGLVLTVYAPWGPHIQGQPNKGKTAPLITMGVAQRADEAEQLWRYLVDAFGAHPSAKMPPVPWCAVSLHEPLSVLRDALEWLGDFERCAAWAWITRNPALTAVPGGKRSV